MLIDSKRVRSPANEKAFMARDLSPAELRAVRKGVGAALRTLYSDVLHKEIPNRIAELLSTTESQRRYLIEITWFFKNAPFSKNPTISITSSNCRHSSIRQPDQQLRQLDQKGRDDT
jgi:hypothetical protein